MVDLTKKRCNCCGAWKGTEQYRWERSKRYAPKTKREAQCRACVARKTKEYKKRNAEKIAEYNSVTKDRRRESRRKYLEDPENLRRQREATQRWAYKNSTLASRRTTEWKKANPERASEIARQGYDRRRAKRLSVFFEAIDRLIVWERDQGICGLCGQLADANDWHLEHSTPLSRGGSHTYDNVTVSHPRCNIRKNSKTLDEWFALPPEWRA